ncbi:MAG: hypothetical protein IJJ01_08020, partial [Firmicutes bacterium]|nr:hypothetical protein [Bacillota bacterium]
KGMADSFIAGCCDPKNASPDQLIPLLYKTSAAAEITLCLLHFHGTKNTASFTDAVFFPIKLF